MSRCRLEQAADGGKFPTVTRGNEQFRLGSSYDGAYAAERWMAYHAAGDRMENAILFGLGDCHIAVKLAGKIPGHLVVYEPEEAVYKEVRHISLFSLLLKNKRVHIVHGTDAGGKLRNEIARVLNDDCVERTAVLNHPGYLSRYPGENQMLQDICQKICTEIWFSREAMQRHMKAMIRNLFLNMPYLKDGIPEARLAKYWDPEIPVVLVSAGPSLVKNMDELKKVDRRAFIFCVDTALSTVLKRGIRPDLVGTTDAQKNLANFEEPGSLDIPYLVTCNSHPQIVSHLTRQRIWGYDHECVRMLMERHGIEVSKYHSSYGIAGGMFAFLMNLGVKHIILVGQDLAYSEDKRSHIDGRNEAFSDREAREVEGYYGKRVYTRTDWNTFREWFEKMIAVLPEDHVVVNATEGGARIHGTVQRPLCEVIAGLPQKRYSLDDMLSDARVRLTGEEYEAILSDWKRNRMDLQEIKNQGYHKTFFETDYHQIPVMDIVLGYMRYLKEVPDREERFRMAVDYLYGQILEYEGQEDAE